MRFPDLHCFLKLHELGPGSDIPGVSNLESLDPISFLLTGQIESLRLKSIAGYQLCLICSVQQSKVMGVSGEYVFNNV